jgi:glycerate kinase
MHVKVVIAPDKFKGSLTSFEVCDAIEKGLQKASPSFDIIKLPLADGGDGLSEVISYYTHATPQPAEVFNPLFKKIYSSWLLSADGKTAFIEMAKASGLQLLQPAQYNPSQTSTYGTGQLIKTAIDRNVEQIILGIGGSATNDGGIGMASALGYTFIDENDKKLSPIGGNLIHIKHIIRLTPNPSPHGDGNVTSVDIDKVQVQVACDVKNLLYGENGASRMYGPQKGADAQMVEELEAGMMNYAEVVKKDLGVDVSKTEGGGAAGGLGAGCIAFLNAELINGIQLVMQYANVEEHIRNADLVITGEGKLDEQTLEGKLVAGIASLGKKYNKPVTVLCGSRSITDKQLQQLGVSAFSIMDQTKNLEEAIRNASYILTDIAFQLGSHLFDKQNL